MHSLYSCCTSLNSNDSYNFSFDPNKHTGPDPFLPRTAGKDNGILLIVKIDDLCSRSPELWRKCLNNTGIGSDVIDGRIHGSERISRSRFPGC